MLLYNSTNNAYRVRSERTAIYLDKKFKEMRSLGWSDFVRVVFDGESFIFQGYSGGDYGDGWSGGKVCKNLAELEEALADFIKEVAYG